MNRVKKTSTSLLLVILVAFGVGTQNVSAHVLESGSGVSAILHIKPDDYPIAGKPVPVNFLFSNDAGGFSLNDYKVQLRLVKNDSVRLTSPIEPLFFGSATEGETVITFPEAVSYELLAVGTPIDKESPSFTLKYTVKVADTAANAAKKGDGSMTAFLSGFSVIALGAVATKTIRSGGKYSRTAKLK